MSRDRALAWIGGVGLLAVRWRRFDAAFASIVVGNLVLALGLLEVMPTGGFLPVFWALLAGSAAAVVGSPASPARPTEALG